MYNSNQNFLLKSYIDTVGIWGNYEERTHTLFLEQRQTLVFLLLLKNNSVEKSFLYF